MRVRRKSEIAAQEVWDFVYSEASESCTDEEEIAKIADILAAHYEPVPEPPAVQEISAFKNIEHGEKLNTPAPHRATIAPCQLIKGRFHVLIDGETVQFENTFLTGDWCGTEAEAKAKLESLRGENNGGK